jgi:hypothetical protein
MDGYGVPVYYSVLQVITQHSTFLLRTNLALDSERWFVFYISSAITVTREPR